MPELMRAIADTAQLLTAVQMNDGMHQFERITRTGIRVLVDSINFFSHNGGHYQLICGV